MNKNIKYMTVFIGAVALILLSALVLSGSQDSIKLKLTNSQSQDNTKLTNNDISLYSKSSASLPLLGTEELSNYSDTIVIGTVNKILPSKWTSVDGKRPINTDSFTLERFIYTDIIINVDKYLKNPLSSKELSSKEVTVRLDGGTVGNDTLEADYEPTFKPGEKVLLFLAKDVTIGTSNIEPNHLRVTGCMQGKFTLTNDGKAVRPDKTVSQDELLKTALQ